MTSSTRLNNRPPALLVVLIAAAMLSSIIFLSPPGAEAQDVDKAAALVSAPVEILGAGTDPKLSDNGRFVVWVGPGSTAADIVREYDQIFYHDRQTGTTTLVSQSGGVEGNDQSLNPQISDDGRYVAFSSKASNLDAADTDSRIDVYLADMTAGTLSVISPDDGAIHADPVLSGDGTVLLYSSQQRVDVNDGDCPTFRVVQHSIVTVGAPFSAPSWTTPGAPTRAKDLDRTGAVLGYDVDGVDSDFRCPGAYVSERAATTGTFEYMHDNDDAFWPNSEVVDVSADGRTLVIKDTENSARVIDLTTGTVLFDTVDFTAVGVISDDRTVLLRDGGVVDLVSERLLDIAMTPQDMNAAGTIVVGASKRRDSPAEVSIADASGPLTETCQGVPATIVGSGVIKGSDGDDVIVGSSGRDTINGFGGNDIICGLGGDDILRGSTGDDVILAGGGDDVVTAGSGNDRVFGGAGADEIVGGTGMDEIYGGDGDDEIFAGVGADDVFGGTGNDEIDGGAGNDDVFGQDGDDTLDGGAGNDKIVGGLGADAMSGGPGNDLVTYIDSTGPVAVSIDGTADDGQAGEADNVDVTVEAVIGSPFDDTLIGSGDGNILRGLAGDDLIRGAGGADTLFGGSGNDVIQGGGGIDQLDGGAGTGDLCRGGGSIDTFLRCETVIQ